MVSPPRFPRKTFHGADATNVRRPCTTATVVTPAGIRSVTSSLERRPRETEVGLYESKDPHGFPYIGSRDHPTDSCLVPTSRFRNLAHDENKKKAETESDSSPGRSEHEPRTGVGFMHLCEKKGPRSTFLHIALRCVALRCGTSLCVMH